jgi:hypothetical protein
MLADYRGPANSEGIFDALIGDAVSAVFTVESPHVGWERWFVMQSGAAFVTNITTGAFWVEREPQVRAKVDGQRRRVSELLRQAQRLGTVVIAAAEEDPAIAALLRDAPPKDSTPR